MHPFCGAGASKGCAYVFLTDAVRRNDAKLTAVCIMTPRSEEGTRPMKVKTHIQAGDTISGSIVVTGTG